MTKYASRMWFLVLGGLCAALLTAPAAHAAPFYKAWEGDDWPENEGWERVIYPPAAQRTLENGVLTIDSLATWETVDAYYIPLADDFVVAPGEEFVMEFRVRTREQIGSTDGGLGIVFGSRYALNLYVGGDSIRFTPQQGTIPIAPGVFHSYSLRSTDMQSFTLSIDGATVHVGTMVYLWTANPGMAWGDLVFGGAGLHDWDYVRFGIVPEPLAAPAIVCVSILRGRAA